MKRILAAAMPAAIGLSITLAQAAHAAASWRGHA